MNSKHIKIQVLFALFVLAVCLPAHAVNKDLVQLQTQVQTLQDTVQQMQQSIDERLGVMRNLIDQTSDSMNKINGNLDTLNKTLQQSHGEADTKVDQVSGQVQQLNDAVDELKARLAKISKQLDDLQAGQQNLSANPSANNGNTNNGGSSTLTAQAPPAQPLYDNALRDYNGGKYDLAVQEFGDYLKYYPTTDLAGNAQFYLAEIEYQKGSYPQAIQDYDKVLEQYPGGNKTQAAQLKKGFALLATGQKDAGVTELRNLIARYPKSLEAAQAKDRLKKLGAAPTASGTTSHGSKPSAAHHN